MRRSKYLRGNSELMDTETSHQSFVPVEVARAGRRERKLSWKRNAKSFWVPDDAATECQLCGQVCWWGY